MRRIKRHGGVVVDDRCGSCGRSVHGRFAERSRTLCPSCAKATAEARRLDDLALRSYKPSRLEVVDLLYGADGVLNWYEATAIDMYYGLHGNPRSSTLQIARRLHMGEDRARRTRNEALRKLRDHAAAARAG